MGSLMSALDAIDRYSLETRKPVTVPLLKAAMTLSPAAGLKHAGAGPTPQGGGSTP